MPTKTPVTILDKMSTNHIEKYWSNVDIKSEEECWEWRGHTDKKGYGVMSVGGRDNQTKLLTHRIAKTLTNKEELPDDKILMHMCDNPPCCNPGHLVLGTHQDNMNDKVNKGRQPVSFGHAKTDWDIVDDIRSSILSSKQLSEKHNLPKSTISEIRNNKTWKEEHREQALVPLDVDIYNVEITDDCIKFTI